MNFNDYIWAMSLALDEAEKAYRIDEVPVGACIIDGQGKVIACAHNSKEQKGDPCGHAEINAIQKAASELENWRLSDCHLVVTLEPCVMCAGAIVQSRLASVIFGAYDVKGGFLSLNYNIHRDKRLNHNFSVMGGVSQHACAKILSDFFKQKRKSYKYSK